MPYLAYPKTFTLLRNFYYFLFKPLLDKGDNNHCEGLWRLKLSLRLPLMGSFLLEYSSDYLNEYSLIPELL